MIMPILISRSQHFSDRLLELADEKTATSSKLQLIEKTFG
jgi:hypothetical protein